MWEWKLMSLEEVTEWAGNLFGGEQGPGAWRDGFVGSAATILQPVQLQAVGSLECRPGRAGRAGRRWCVACRAWWWGPHLTSHSLHASPGPEPSYSALAVYRCAALVHSALPCQEAWMISKNFWAWRLLWRRSSRHEAL